jgi:hypothetical protein
MKSPHLFTALVCALLSFDAQALDVLFIGLDATPTASADSQVMSYLQTRYSAANVVYMQASANSTGDELSYDALVISSSVSSSAVRGKFHNSTVGIVNWESVIFDGDAGEFGMTTVVVPKSTDTTQLTIAAGAHPIAAGFSGTVTFITGGEILYTNNVFTGLTSVANGANGAAAGSSVILVAEVGENLLATSGASPCKGRRVMFPISGTSFSNLTTDGLQLFGQSVDWAGGGAAVAAPSIGNSPAAGVTATMASIGGTVSGTGGESPNVTIYWGDNDGGTSPGSWDNSVDVGVQNGAFSTNLGGLATGTDHFFRCFAINSAGSAWASSTATFTTAVPASPPVVTNLAATSVSFLSAELNGEVTSTGGEAPTVSVYWGTVDGGSNAAAWQNSINLGIQSNSFTFELGALQHSTTYFYRCFAGNSGGTDWTNSTESFTTQSVLPATLTIDDAVDVTGVSARVGGAVTGTGGDSPTVTIFYGTTDGGTTPGSWQSSVNMGIQSGSFDTVLSGLQSTTNYFYTARAVNAGGTSWAAAAKSFTTLEVSTLLINEFMASNSSTVAPNAMAGVFEDWIEIHNTGTVALDLAGWHLTDDSGNPSMWTFPPSTTISDLGYLVVFASNNNAPDVNGNLHTNFKLTAGGDYIALVRPNLTIASEFGPGGTAYPAQSSDVSYGLAISDQSPVYFAQPTPGAANTGQIQVEDTKFSHKRGYYTSAFNATITTATSGATIRYTLDGTVPLPTGNGTTYSGPIPVTTTTTLRAIAFKSGFAQTNIDTQTYIFPNDVVTQTRPAGYPTAWGGEPSADYDIDPQISQSAQYSARFLEGLRSVPTMSVVCNKDEIFATGGIYVDTQNRNVEASVSAEYFHPDSLLDGLNVEDGFQIDCGFKLQGGASRNPGSSIKHSMSLRFRAQYGQGSLNYSVFDGTNVATFDSIHLRAMYNNSWIHSSQDQPQRATMIRDQWARDSMIDMGNADGGQGHFVHLYINGIYWGLYNLHERLENDHYANYNGYNSSEVVGRNPGTPSAAEQAYYNSMISVVTNASSTWAQIQAVLDIDNYVDYFMVQNFGLNSDLKTNDNWRSAGGGTANAPWRFYCWDTERILESQTNLNSPGAGGDGAEIFDDLSKHREFRVRFQDRANKHLFNEGALTNLNNRNRFEKYVFEIDTAIVCESARWGDDRSGGGFNGNFARDEDWIPALYGIPSGPGTNPTNGVFGSWFPLTGANRTTIIVNNWRTRTFAGTGSSDTFLGSVIAPVFTVNGSNQHGGEIPPGGTLSATAAAGSIYYTTDGSDPRSVGGGVSAGAILLSGNMTLPSSGLVGMRVRNGAGDSWSALSEANFYLENRAEFGDLRISEIHYNATGPFAIEAVAGANLAVPRKFTGADFDFIEVRNVSAETVNLDGAQFTKGVGFTFPLMTLAPGNFVIVAADVEAFSVRYGSGLPVAGQYAGTLDDGGELLTLVTWEGSDSGSVTFDNSGEWAGRADGKGSSLELINTASAAISTPDKWRASCEFNGSPGALGAGSDGRLVINEVFTNPELPDVDAIEIKNTSAGAISIDRLYLSDSSSNYRKFKFSAVGVQANAYAVYSEVDFNSPAVFSISNYSGAIATAPTTVTSTAHGLATGDIITISSYGGIGGYNDSFEVTLVDADSFMIDTVFLDNVAAKGTYTSGQPFGLSSNGETLWLIEGDGDGRLIKFVDQVDFAAARGGESLGRWPDGAGHSILISMVSKTLSAANSGPQVGPVVVTEVMYAAASDSLEFVEICNTGSAIENLANWRLRGGADFDFTAAQELAPGGNLVVVAFDPANSLQANAFRTAYGIGASVVLAGPFSGALMDDLDTVRLQRADLLNGSVYPQVTEDEIRYLKNTPWPPASGNGLSLQRTDLDGFGNFPVSWMAAAPNPGDKPFDYADWAATNNVAADPLQDFDSDGVANLVEYALGMNPGKADVKLLPTIALNGASVQMIFPKNPALDDITYQVEMSTNLTEWSDVSDTLKSTANGIEMRSASVSLSPNERVFLRLRIVRP